MVDYLWIRETYQSYPVGLLGRGRCNASDVDFVLVSFLNSLLVGEVAENTVHYMYPLNCRYLLVM